MKAESAATADGRPGLLQAFVSYQAPYRFSELLSFFRARAVGGAVGHNPISIIVPCHRVIGAGGNLTGFGGGIKRKLWLLEHEGVDCSGFFIPKHSTAP